MAQYLVTGVAGFIGAAVAAALLRREGVLGDLLTLAEACE